VKIEEKVISFHFKYFFLKAEQGKFKNITLAYCQKKQSPPKYSFINLPFLQRKIFEKTALFPSLCFYFTD